MHRRLENTSECKLYQGCLLPRLQTGSAYVRSPRLESAAVLHRNREQEEKILSLHTRETAKCLAKNTPSSGRERESATASRRLRAKAGAGKSSLLPNTMYFSGRRDSSCILISRQTMVWRRESALLLRVQLERSVTAARPRKGEHTSRDITHVVLQTRTACTQTRMALLSRFEMRHHVVQSLSPHACHRRRVLRHRRAGD